ncbi:MAG: polymer-forming cytoskeletal protein [Rhodocyclaceae bacterium]|nr:polymer-forming cytoskeletal protein [Rhodocyclaceae bacterium]
MAIFGKKQPDESVGVGVDIVPPVVAAVGKGGAGSAAAGETEGSRLVVGPNVRLTGSEIADCDTVIVEGRVEATVDGRVMQIAETGMFTGTAAIDMAEIRGQFHGDLSVRKRLTVCGTGRVKGKIRYGALVVEEGGELSGDVDSLNTAPATSAAKSPVVKEVQAGPVAGGKPETPLVQGYPPRGLAG